MPTSPRAFFWIGAALSAPLLLLAMGAHIPAVAPLLERVAPSGLSRWLELALATPVVLWAGAPFFRRGWKSVATLNLNMFTLIALGVGAAYAYSVVATAAPGVFPAAFRDPSGAVGLYFEAAAAIVVLVLLGQVLELRARERTGRALRALLDLAPETARRINPDGTEEDVPLELVEAGDRLRVRPGEIQSAAVILVRGDLSGIVRARRLSRAVMRNIRQNLLLAFVYNSLGVWAVTPHR